MKIAIGADHAGFDLKEEIKRRLVEKGIVLEDVGCHGKESVDYPDYAREVATRVQSGSVEQGVLICKTGIGMSIAANRFRGVRAALCLSPGMAALARLHNDANVLVLGGDTVPASDAGPILDAWVSGKFEGGRHVRRLAKIEDACRPAK